MDEYNSSGRDSEAKMSIPISPCHVDNIVLTIKGNSQFCGLAH